MKQKQQLKTKMESLEQERDQLKHEVLQLKESKQKQLNVDHLDENELVNLISILN
jgi:cell division protein FtsB